MTFQEILRQKHTELVKLNEALKKDQGKKGTEFDDLCKKTAVFTRMLGQYLDFPYNLTPEERKNWSNAFAEMAKAAKEYTDDHDGFLLTSDGRSRQRTAKALFELAYGMKDRIYNVGKSMEEADEFEHNFTQGNMTGEIARMEDYMLVQKPRLYPEDCFKKEDHKIGTFQFFKDMIWLAEQEQADREATGRGAGIANTGIYGVTFQKMQNVLVNASDRGQNYFASWMELYRTALIDHLAHSMAKYQAEELAGNPESAKVRLYKDPDYRKLESLSILEESLGSTAKHMLANVRFSDAYKNRPSVQQMEQFLPGKLSQILKSEGRLEEAQAARRAGADALVKSTGYGQNAEDISRLFEVYKNMMEDTDSASTSYGAVRKSLGRFLGLDHAAPTEREAYLSSLTIALQTADNYLNSHRAKAHYAHKYGRIRRNAITAVKRILEDRKALVMRELEEQAERAGNRQPGAAENVENQQPGILENIGNQQPGMAENAGNPQPGMAENAGNPQPGMAENAENPQPGMAENVENPQQRMTENDVNQHPGMAEHVRNSQPVMPEAVDNDPPEDLGRIGRVHRITSTRFVPREVDRNLSQGKVSRFFGDIFHGISNAIAAIPASITTFPLKLFNAKKQGIKPMADRHHFNQIPLLASKEKFEKFDPDSKPADQEILSDARRTPLVWEREINADPNQEPTFTIYAEQSSEDSERAHAVLGGDVGHTYVSLEYTRNDPLTGTPKRYRTNFGFYPRDINGGNTYLFASTGLQGSTQPGMMVNDWDHPSNAGITFKVTNRQINRVFLAAQNYAQGGYNMVTRNCTNFAKDMAEEAGLDVSDLFFKSDFEAGAAFTIGTGIGLTARDILFMAGKNQLIREADNKMDYDYQLLGQQNISGEDIHNFSNVRANIRMEGYNPSRLAEAIKASGKGTFFHTHKDSLQDLDSKETDYGFPAKLETETKALRDKLVSFISERGLAEGEQIIAEFNDILENINGLLDNLKNGLKINKNDNETIIDVYKRSRLNLNTVINKTEQAEKDLEVYYKNVFHADKELYTPFQHMVGFLDQYRMVAEEKLCNIDETITKSINDVSDGSPERNMLKKMAASQREDSNAAAEFRFGICRNRGGYSTIADYVAESLVYPEEMNYNDDLIRYGELVTADDVRRLSKEEKSEKNEILNRINVFDAVKSSLRYYVNAQKLSKGDTDFIFGKISENCERSVAGVFKAFAWKLGLEPTRDKIKQAASKAVNERLNTFKTLADANASEEASASAVADHENGQHAFEIECLKILASSMKPQNQNLNYILKSIMQDSERNNRSTFPVDQEEIKNLRSNALQAGISEISDNLISYFISAQINQASMEIREGMEDFQDKIESFLEPTAANLRDILTSVLVKAMQNMYPKMAEDFLPTTELTEEDEALVPDFQWLTESIKNTTGFSLIYPEVCANFENIRGRISELKQNKNLTPEEEQLKNGLKTVWEEGMKSVKQMADQAGFERKFLTRGEQREIKKEIGKLSLTVYLEKLNENDRNGILLKIAEDPKNYDKYVTRIIQSREFEHMLQNPAPLKPNNLDQKGMMKSLLNRIDGMMTKEFSKNIHLNNTILEDHAPQQQNRPTQNRQLMQ